MHCKSFITSIFFLLFTIFSCGIFASPVDVDVVGVKEEPRSLEKRAVPPPQTDTTFINAILGRVNGYRALHSAPALTWDANLANTARTAASRCDGQHIPNNVNGENIYNFWLIPKTTVPNFTLWAKKAVAWWYSEVGKYDVNNPAPAYHFTQVVWKNSRKIGCAWSANQCPTTNGDYYLYCEFQPKGNLAGQFPANVIDA